MKKENGITLIALIITVIILLILAGVAISSLGNSGLFSKSKDAVNKYSEAEKNEAERLNEYLNAFDENAQDNGKLAEEIGVVEFVEDNTKYTDSDGNTATIPGGFGVSDETDEQNINDGLVVKDKKGNEFIWIPVNNMGDFTDEINKRAIVNSFVTPGRTQLIISKLTHTATGLREPAYFENEPGYINDVKESALSSTIQNEYNSMVESVKKFEGFYIGRYETSNVGTDKPEVKKGGLDITNHDWYTFYEKGKLIANSSKVKSNMMWGSQWDRMLTWISEDITYKEFIINPAGVSNLQDQEFGYEKDGGFEIKEAGIAELLPTGSAFDNKLKNIYDVIGNANEWTMQATALNARISRGADYTGISNFSSVVDTLSVHPNNKNVTVGMRVQLYIVD